MKVTEGYLRYIKLSIFKTDNNSLQPMIDFFGNKIEKEVITTFFADN